MSPAAIPRFRASLRMDVVRPDLLLILSEKKRSAIAHKLLAQLSNWIDGKRNVEQITHALQAQLTASEVMWGLNHLQQRGYLLIEPAESSLPMSTSITQAWWEVFGVPEPQKMPRISLQALVDFPLEPLAQSLQFAGVAIHPSAESQMHLLLLDDAGRTDVLEIARQCTQQNKPLLIVKANGSQPSIGPLLHPQLGSCAHCLQFWLRQQQPLQTWLNRQQVSQGHFLPLAYHPGAALALYGMLAQAIVQLFASGQDHIALRDHILALDLKTLQTSKHKVVRRPQCPACGDADLLARRGWQMPPLQNVVADACQDGGFRQQEPQATFAQYQHLINPICGPISYLHPMPGRHQGIRKVYVAGYLTCPEEAPYVNNFDKICAGKGHTDEQAKTSALCESLERWSGVWQGNEACRRTSLASLRAEGARVHEFNALQNFSERQFAMRAEINFEQSDVRRQIPLPHAADKPIDWTPAWSLSDHSLHYVPLAYCYAQAPASSAAGFGIHNPNGCAAGVGREEAVLQAMLELVERDACAIWWYNRVPRPHLALDEIDDTYANKLHAHYKALGWQIWALDLTHDLAIPVYAALAFEPKQARYAIGFGCHLDAKLALQRALTELNQLFDPQASAIAPWDAKLLNDSSFLHPHFKVGQLPQQRAGQDAMLGSHILLADIGYCQQQFTQAGLECLLLDKTRPEIGLAVMQVIVPGLRHFWPRFGAGRLYDVPVKLGWLARACAETELNPAPLFL